MHVRAADSGRWGPSQKLENSPKVGVFTFISLVAKGAGNI